MAQPETILQNRIRLEVAKRMAPRVVLFRNHSGSLPDPKRGGAWVTYGLGPGSPDLVGWRVLPSGVAQFVGIEVKLPGEQPRPDQRTWIDNIQAAGGLAGYVTSVQEALALLLTPPFSPF